VGTLILVAAAGGPSTRVLAARALLTLAVAWLAARLLREGLHLPRPAALGLGHAWIDHASGPGLPSQHATGAFALAFALREACHRRSVVAAMFAVALLVSWSRLLLGVHFPSDILAGALVGALAARSTSLVWRVAVAGLRNLRIKPPALGAGR
jgi:undecaprenyl-diphosphatase